MVQVAEHYASEDEYLALDVCSERNHEYFNGRIYAMSARSLSMMYAPPSPA